ncbi:MAG: PGPGW domain-containing protein [Pirellulaceae bacterium]
MFDWIHENATLFWWLTGFSIVAFVGTLVLIPVLVARIPDDYFLPDRHRQKQDVVHPVIHLVLLVAKNLLGVVLILIGIVMLVAPGQGLLTILIGILLMDFPGKYRLERWLISRPPIHKSVNWLRKKSKRPPIRIETDQSEG